MTIQCMCCHRILGEKCSECGGEAFTLTEIFPKGLGSKSERRAICKNWDCQRTFPIGNGGVTHGICSECCRRLLKGIETSQIPV